MRLVHKIIFHDSKKGCRITGKKEDWQGLPKNKSLFFSKTERGLPIGNLTSQLFGNVYLNDFDHFVVYVLGCKYYCRYVDDIVIVHSDKECLKLIIPIISKYLRTELFLEVHPKKIYLQHFSKGVKFLGTFIKPYRIYIGQQTKANFYNTIQKWNNFLKKQNLKLEEVEENLFLASMNSYLGLLRKRKTYRLRQKMLDQILSFDFRNYIYFFNDYQQIFKNRDKDK